MRRIDRIVGLAAPSRSSGPGLARSALLIVVIVGLASIAIADPVAGVIATVGGGLTILVLRRRSRSMPRIAAGFLAACVTLTAVVLAFRTYDFRAPVAPLLVTRNTDSAPRLVAKRTGRPFEVLGFVDSTSRDSAPGVDRDAPLASEIAATGITLDAKPGTISTLPPRDALLRSHMQRARGYVVVSNWSGHNFDGQRARRALEAPAAAASLVRRLRHEVVRGGFDGIVVDLERLPRRTRAPLVDFVVQLKHAIGPNRTVVVAIPAYGRADEADETAFDLAALGRAADRVVWMAYDQHTPDGDPGPIAEIDWVRDGLRTAEAAIPRSKLLLGVAGYGYYWPHRGDNVALTYQSAARLAATPGALVLAEPTAGEQWIVMPDGGQAWFSDARAFKLRADVAAAHGLAGIAMWRLGAEDPSTLNGLPAPPIKHPGLPVGSRPIKLVGGAGVVALTFDDGPDPQWTPRILAILRRNHVPATFFAVGRNVALHPGIVRDEVREGSVVGSHTFTHPNFASTPEWRVRLEILAGRLAVEGVTGLNAKLYRAPYGVGDFREASGATADDVAIRMGLNVTDWTVDPRDWIHTTSHLLATSIVAHATPRTVVLLHDGGGDRSSTVAALPDLIKQLKERGYSFTTADQLDAGMTSPYASRDGFASALSGIAIIAGFRLFRAFLLVVMWLALALAGFALLRLLVAFPLALVQARRHRRHSSAWGPRPSACVVIPAHNEGRVIRKSLDALVSLTDEHRPEEIVVVDDGSTDDTAAIVSRYRGVRLIRQRHGGKAAALNAGISATSAEIVIALDADTVVTPGFVSAVCAPFADPSVGAVAGNVKVGNRRRLLPRFQAIEYLIALDVDRRAQHVLNTIAVVPGASGAYRRRAVLDVGGFPAATMVEDADLTVSLQRAGWFIPYAPDAVAWTEAPERIRDVLKQRRRWAFGTVQVCARHWDAMLADKGGRIGLIGLPWTLLSQIVVPALAPAIDAYLIWLLVVSGPKTVTTVLLLAAVLDITLTAAVVVVAHERLSLILLAPFVRWVWRPLQMFAVLWSAHRWCRGESHRWSASTRYDTVNAAHVLSESHRRGPKPSFIRS